MPPTFWRHAANEHLGGSAERSALRRTMVLMLTVAQAADRIGRSPETVRRWIRSGKLPAKRVGTRHAIEPRELDQIASEIYPMADLPDEWKTGDNGEPALNWVAAIHRSRTAH
jgi:excisionase family DNA binding protein